MTSISIDTSQIDGYATGMAQAPAIIREEFLRSTNRLALQGVAFAQALTPVRTGHLRRANAATPAVWAGGATATYGNATPYARPVEFGRRGFSARPGGALGPMNIGGRIVFAKSVGPAAARPFIRPSVARLRPLVPREYRAAMQRVMARIGGA
jgi:hypothetical protein